MFNFLFESLFKLVEAKLPKLQQKLVDKFGSKFTIQDFGFFILSDGKFINLRGRKDTHEEMINDIGEDFSDALESGVIRGISVLEDFAFNLDVYPIITQKQLDSIESLTFKIKKYDDVTVEFDFHDDPVSTYSIPVDDWDSIREILLGHGKVKSNYGSGYTPDKPGKTYWNDTFKCNKCNKKCLWGPIPKGMEKDPECLGFQFAKITKIGNKIIRKCPKCGSSGKFYKPDAF